MTPLQTIKQIGKGALIQAFCAYVSNENKRSPHYCDAHSLAYKIGMIDHHLGTLYTYGTFKRAQVLERLFELVCEGDNIYKVIQSDYVASQVLSFVNAEREAERAFFRSHPELNP